jgi:hypothetical protein
LAASPGTDVDPMWSMRSARSRSAFRSSRPRITNCSDQVGKDRNHSFRFFLTRYHHELIP